MIGFLIVNMTFVPLSPLILLVASFNSNPLVDSPSIFIISSPVKIPARDAGDPSIGPTTVN